MKKTGEQGVITIITGVTVLTLVTVLLVLYLKSRVVKQASFDLRLRTQQLCEGVARDQLFTVQHQALEQFRQLLDAEFSTPLGPAGVATLQDVDLFLPGMPGHISFDPLSRAALPFLDFDGDNHNDYSGQPLRFAQLGARSCAGVAGMSMDCGFSPAAGTALFPQTMWNNVEHAGAAIGCRARATVDVFFDFTGAADPEIEAVFAYWRPVRGAFPEHFTDALGVSREQPALNSMPGLSLAIATHMTTNAADPRFRFPANDWDLEDPLHDFTRGTAHGQPNMYDSSTTAVCLPSDSNTCVAVPDRISALYQSAQWTGAEPGDEVDHAGDGVTDTEPTDYEEMRVACMNPVVLVRNAFLSTVVELLGRHGQLRSSTEILHVGTQHRDLCSGACKDCSGGGAGCVPDHLRLPEKSGFPTVIVPFGKDLVRPDLTSGLDSGSYQIPYVSFYGGMQLGVDVPPQFGLATNGLIDPLTRGAATEWQRYYALIAGQLRYCYHLYQCDYDLSAPSCAAEEISRFFPDHLHSSLFEDEGFQPVPGLFKPDAGAAWDQACPWDDTDPKCARGGGSAGGAGGRPRNSGLTAAELVAALGTTQICPYRKWSSALWPGSNVCRKSGWYDTAHQVTNDLRPDFRALIEYLQGATKSAVRSPGLFSKRSSSYNWSVDLLGKPFAAGEYRSAVNLFAPLLLVTHVVPTPAETEVVRALVSGAAWHNRPITVVFIPTGSGPASQVERLRRAFLATTADRDSHNRVYMFSPYEVADWGSMTNESDKFRTYWLELIDPGSYLQYDQSIIWKALNIFTNDLTRTQRKL